MSESGFVSPNTIRAAFSAAMSAMYRDEVPAYGTLIDIVAEVNDETLARDPHLKARLSETDSLDRISDERHGAIRVGTPEELRLMRRIFAVMGMFPVSYYDLSVAGIPVHSTAFRPLDDKSLKINPFRVFTSLLRLDLIEDETLRDEAARTLSSRDIVTPGARALLDRAEADGGLNKADADAFVAEVLETFRWHDKALVDAEMYRALHDTHRLIADVVSFRGPHINHLTPRTLDIDRVQAMMPERGIAPKAVVEGPPARRCPILLRQTSFKALEEDVSFQNPEGGWEAGHHTARFGEIEQRGAALTPRGRALYDTLLNGVRDRIKPAADGSNASEYMDALAKGFAAFPDDWAEMRKQGLAYFAYSLTEAGKQAAHRGGEEGDLKTLIEAGLVTFDPIVYEDFLPVSAAGIFESNLGDDSKQDFSANPNRDRFEADLGAPVADEFEHYAAIETDSIRQCLEALMPLVRVE
ncbi:2-oxoadipate dioxygenase/decarboxylase HglS [Cucumibacter marinus]|uniref:2-oxoadipate dioxygenase/decarboxylase HglS n=1 Tax=Cucumibacter marinus TaxID=1121252 RepID=UPI00041B6CA1|nr:VOC family protein [Cucumibacter marinus]